MGISQVYAYEDFTTYTEQDDDGCLTVITNKITATAMPNDNSNYVVKDWGVSGVSGDFEFNFEFQIDSATYLGRWWFRFYESGTTFVELVFLYGGGTFYTFFEGYDVHGAMSTSATEAGSADTPYFVTVIRDEDGGAYGNGEWTYYVRETSHDGTIIATDTLVDVQEQVDYRYFYPVHNYNGGQPALTFTGFLQNLSSSVTPMPKIDSFYADPASISVGDTTDLTWTTSNTSGVSISSIGAVSLSGTSETGTLNTTTVFTLSAEGYVGQTTTEDITVTVCDTPSIDSFSTQGGSLRVGQSVPFSWTTSNSSGVSILGFDSVALSGTSSITMSGATSFTIQAVNCVGQNASETIYVSIFRPEDRSPPAMDKPRWDKKKEEKGPQPKWDKTELEWEKTKKPFDERVEIDQPPEGWFDYNNWSEFKVSKDWPTWATREFNGLMKDTSIPKRREKFLMWDRPPVSLNTRYADAKADRTNRYIKATVNDFKYFTVFKIIPEGGTIEQDFKGNAIIYNLDEEVRYKIVCFDSVGYLGASVTRLQDKYIRINKTIGDDNPYKAAEDPNKAIFYFINEEDPDPNYDTLRFFIEDSSSGEKDYDLQTQMKVWDSVLPLNAFGNTVFDRRDGVFYACNGYAWFSGGGIYTAGYIYIFNAKSPYNILGGQGNWNGTGGGWTDIALHQDFGAVAFKYTFFGDCNSYLYHVDKNFDSHAWDSDGVNFVNQLVHGLMRDNNDDYVLVSEEMKRGAPGGAQCTESNNKAHIRKLDGTSPDSGNTIYDVSYNNVHFYDIAQHPSNDFYVIAGSDGTDGFLKKINSSDGSTISTITVENSDSMRSVEHCVENLGYIASGYGTNSETGKKEMILLKIGLDFTIEWENRFTSSISYDNYGLHAKETIDRGFLMLGFIESLDRDTILVKTNQYGESCSQGTPCE